MKWRVEKATVVRRVWGPGDTYEAAGYDGPQVFGHKEGDVVCRIVSEFSDYDPEELQEFVNFLNEVSYETR